LILFFPQVVGILGFQPPLHPAPTLLQGFVIPMSSKSNPRFPLQVVSVLGFKLPHYPAPTLLLGFGLSIRVLWHLIMTRPHIIHASSPGAHRCRVSAAVPFVS